MMAKASPPDDPSSRFDLDGLRRLWRSAVGFGNVRLFQSNPEDKVVMTTGPASFQAAIASIRSALGQVEVHAVPAGIAIGTATAKADGDRVGFFLIEQKPGVFRLEDGGDAVPMAVACGVDLVNDDGAPTTTLDEILSTNGVSFDLAAVEIFVEGLSAENVGPAASRLVTALQYIDAATAAI